MRHVRGGEPISQVLFRGAVVSANIACMAPSKAVFLSYASEDTDAAARICASLRSAGIEVWFDRNELRGGDAWDQKIRRNIKDCALFLPLISANTNARVEGYFRLEWKLAVDRSHLMAVERSFLLPVVIDGTTDGAAVVPDRFREVQWTRLPAGEVPAEFVGLIVRLLEPEDKRSPAAVSVTAPATPPAGPVQEAPRRHVLPRAVDAARRFSRPWFAGLIAGVLVLAFAGGWVWTQRGVPASRVAANSDGVPQTESIAVLPFVNMSSDKEQEYFSDGLSEELLNLLAQLPQLRVIARTSSFSFKGKEVDVATIAKALNVSSVLEGSVRKSGDTVRITAQLIRTSDSAHLWSGTYDRKLTDVLKVQDEIAGAVVAALKVKLLPAQKLTNQRGNANSEAYNQYLLGNQFLIRGGTENLRRAESAFKKALELDPGYAAAWARLSMSLQNMARSMYDSVEINANRQEALAAAEKAIALAPALADGYLYRGWFRLFSRSRTSANADFLKALSLDPGDSNVQRGYGAYLLQRGRIEDARAATRKAIELDPLSANSWANLAWTHVINGQLKEAREALNRALSINPDSPPIQQILLGIELLEKRPQEALLLSREIRGPWGPIGRAMAEYSLGHSKASREALDEAIAKYSRSDAVQIAEAFAWRGEFENAFEWLERGYAANDNDMTTITFNPFFAALVHDPRFQAMMKKYGPRD